MPLAAAAHFIVGEEGIPAATLSSGEWTPGRGACKPCESFIDVITKKFREMSVGYNVTVANDTQQSIAPGTMIRAYLLDGEWFADRASPAQIELFRFTLTAALDTSVGSTATANLVSIIGETSTGTVTSPGRYRGFIGAQGLAVKVNDAYVILQLDQPAQRVFAILGARPEGGGGGVLYAADPRENNAIIDLSPLPVLLTEYPFGFRHSSINSGASGEIANPYNLFGEEGDGAMLDWNADLDAYVVTEIFPAVQREFWATMAGNRPTGESAMGTLMQVVFETPITTGNVPTYSVSLTVRDVFNVAINAKIGHKVLVKWRPAEQQYVAIAAEHQATRLKGTIDASFTTTDTTFVVNVTGAYNGISPGATVTVANRFKWNGTTGKPIEIEYDPTVNGGEWFGTQMECPTP